MRKYLSVKQEQVKLFEQLVAPHLTSNTSVLDAGCGLGDLSYFLDILGTGAKFLGIDADEVRIEAAREAVPSIDFQTSDFSSLLGTFGPKSFDVIVSKAVVSWMPHYAETMRIFLSVARRSMFISSLFYEGKIDYEIKVNQHIRGDAERAYYNIYSFPIFREFCLENGAREVICHDFDIEIDLPNRGLPDRMGTFTLRLDTGRRLQVSGALLLPWKIIEIHI